MTDLPVNVVGVFVVRPAGVVACAADVLNSNTSAIPNVIGYVFINAPLDS